MISSATIASTRLVIAGRRFPQQFSSPACRYMSSARTTPARLSPSSKTNNDVRNYAARNNSSARARLSPSGNGRYSRYNNQRQRHGSIPTYLWVLGGTTIGGSVYMYYHYLDNVPLTDRQRWIATSPEWEQQLGNQEYESLLRQFRGQILPKNHTASKTVERVGRRICNAADQFAKEYDLEEFSTKGTTFTVVRSEMANAFVLPGNHIFVMTGLFQFARDEDELAAVLGHEMGHNLARHVGEKVSGNFITTNLARLSLLLDPSGVLFTIFLPAANLLRDLPHSRTQESEADRIGMHLAAKACYDPQAAQRVFGRMKESAVAGRQPPEFLSTHPSHDTRIKKMDDWLPETRKILHRDGGGYCQHVRQEMKDARRIAAERQLREKEQQRRIRVLM